MNGEEPDFKKALKQIVLNFEKDPKNLKRELVDVFVAENWEQDWRACYTVIVSNQTLNNQKL